MHKPKLRFTADDGSKFPDWEEKRFGETVLIERGGSPRPIEQYLTDDENGYNWIKIGDAPEYGNRITSTVQKIISDGLKKTRRVHVGDLILSNSMSFGKPYILDIDGCIHDGWLLIRDEKNNYNKLYLCYILGSEYMLRQYKKLAAGTGVNNLNKELVSNTKIIVPCLDEQQKIADFLSTIDTVIEKQEATVEAWEERKKGVMQKLFSQEVRFKADDGSEFPDWEEKKLGDISERILVGLATTVTPYYRDSGRPMFRNLNIKQGYLDDSDMLFLDDNYANSQTTKMIKTGDILTVHTGNIGWSCIVPEKYDGALSFTTLITTVQDAVVVNSYVCSFLNSPLGMYKIQNLAFSGGRANLNTSEFQKVLVPVPCLAEQQKIADCLSSLDDVIEKQKATLAAWKEMKKGLLQQMFV